MNDMPSNRLPAKPLPRTVSDLLAQKKVMVKPTLNDHVDSICVKLWDENPDFQKLLDAAWNDEAIEGSCIADDFMASQIIRDYAKHVNNEYVVEKKLSAIVKALHVVMRRYGIDRKGRRTMIGGVSVDNGGGEDVEA